MLTVLPLSSIIQIPNKGGKQMDGVTILNTYQAYSSEGALLLLACVAGLLIFTIAAIVLFDDHIVISVFCAALVILLLGGCFQIKRNDTRYEVLLNDSVSYAEFLEHYKVLHVRGKILEVKEND